MVHQDRVLEWGVRRGLEVRPAAPGDFEAIRRVATTSFPVPPGWAGHPDRAHHYRPEFCSTNEFGSMNASVAARADGGGVVGYCYFQFRPDDDVYVQELATDPPESVGKVRHAGTLLLAHLLGHALARADCRRITANVCKLYRTTVAGPFGRSNVKDPVPFYRRFGFTKYECHPRGYSFDASGRDVRDTWLETPPRPAWEAVRSYLDPGPSRSTQADGKGAIPYGWTH